MPNSLATCGAELPVASFASASRSMRTICSGVCLVFFIESPPFAPRGRLDSHSNWVSFWGAGQHDREHDANAGIAWSGQTYDLQGRSDGTLAWSEDCAHQQ